MKGIKIKIENNGEKKEIIIEKEGKELTVLSILFTR